MRDFPFSGDMSERIYLLTQSITTVGGEDVITESVTSAIPAKVEYIKGMSMGEEIKADQLFTIDHVLFWIRYDSSFTTKKKIRWNGQDRDIKRIEIVDRNRYMKIYTQEYGV